MRGCCAASAIARFGVRCMCSCPPFCSGISGEIRSRTMPSLSHQIDSCDSSPQPVEANGTPVSVLNRSGNP